MAMKIKGSLLILFAGITFLNACKKDVDVFVPDPGQINGPDTSWQNTITATMPVSLLKNNLAQEPVYMDSINVNASIASVTTPFGIQVNFPPNCCATALGQPVTGRVQVELKVIKKKGDMIRLNKPSTFNDSMLVTAGQIFIQLKKEGQLLQLAPGVRINIRYTDLPVNTQMKFFLGEETNTQHFNWFPTPTPSLDTIFMGAQSYDMYTKRQQWISVSNFFDLNAASPRVRITADIAAYFTNANTIAFTVFKDVRSVVAMKGDLSTRKFISGKLPVGKPVTVVVISRQGNDYYLGHESAVTQITASNPALQVVPVVPVKRSLPEILAYLATL
jgi:hypothetical protein